MLQFFCIMFVLNIVNFIFDSFLLHQNNKIQNSTSSLTTRYQRKEVTQSTKFAVFVIFCHVLLFGFYVFGIIFLRYFGSFLVPDATNLTAIRSVFATVRFLSFLLSKRWFQVMPIYNFVVGTVAVVLNRQMKLKKTKEMTATVQMKATGNVGAINYENAISDIWNSVSRR
uniref:Uncharacterized protein n=1 Tax=Caenorhabditis tropicalis TaxID=1561998 RepID=A0A1I7T9F8_9PELO